MHSTNCLNCNTELQGKFCHECGQKSDTHRITPQHFIMHDLLHGVWHIEKGILFTLKEVFTRPGYAAQDYIAGKRVKYYNVFYLIFIVLGFYLIAIGHDESVKNADKFANDFPISIRHIIKFVIVYTKYLILLVIPIFALSSFIMFQRLNFNYSEHIVLSGFITLGSFVLILLGNLFGHILPILNMLSVFGPIMFAIWVYYQVTKKEYALWNYTLRLIPFFFLSMLWLVIGLGIAISFYF